MPDVDLNVYWVASTRQWVISIEQARDFTYASDADLGTAYRKLCEALTFDPRDGAPGLVPT
jgi:hypothetical protein